MRTFLATLAVSLVASTVLWQFGLASRIWPAHPMLATTLVAMAAAIAVQTMLSNYYASQKKAK